MLFTVLETVIFTHTDGRLTYLRQTDAVLLMCYGNDHDNDVSLHIMTQTLHSVCE